MEQSSSHDSDAPGGPLGSIAVADAPMAGTLILGDEPIADVETFANAPGEEPQVSGHDDVVRWRRVLAICLAAFLLWLVIDAPVLEHNAQVQVIGTRRTVALDVLRPIAALSRATGLSHVVPGIDRALGRHSGAPVVIGKLVTSKPVTHPSKGRHKSISPTERAFTHPTSIAPLRTLVLGDSLGLDLGDALVNDLATTNVATATLDGKEATGLSRPDYFNWPAELSSDLPQYNPQVIVIMIGANDAQDLLSPSGDIVYDSASWNSDYTARVRSFVKSAESTGAKVIWVGLPPMQNPTLSAAMAHINGIDQKVVQSLGGVWVDGWDLLGGPDGTYQAYLSVNGQEVNVREPDGIHISPAGAEVLSQGVIAAMRQQLHIDLP